MSIWGDLWTGAPGGTDPADKVRITNLENVEHEYEIFELISATSGTVTIPTNGTIVLNQYTGAGDCLILRVDGANNRPIDEPARDGSGAIITSTFDGSGNYSLSGTPEAYPVAIVYQISLKEIDKPGLNNNYVLNESVIQNTARLTQNVQDWPTFYAFGLTIRAGDKVIFNGVDYVNKTGAYTSTNPSLDTTNWGYSGHLISLGVVTKPTETDNLNGTITYGSDGLYNFYKVADGSGDLVQLGATGATLTLVDNALNYVYASYNAGSPVILSSTNTSVIYDLRNAVLCEIFRTGTVLHVTCQGTPGKVLPEALLVKDLQINKFRKISGLVLTANTPPNFQVSAGSAYHGINIQAMAASQSNVDSCRLYTRTGGVWSSSAITTFNNTQYDDGTNTQTLTNNRYAVNWIYRGVESQNHTYVVLGNGDYTLSQAIASQPDGLPEVISSHAILVGRIIVVKNSTTPAQVDQVTTIPLTPGTVSNHDDLANIGIAGSGVTNGHINTLSQTLVGDKTFQTETTSTPITMSAFNAAASAGGISFRRGRGTAASPTQTQTNDVLGALFFAGTTDTAVATGNIGAIRYLASENHTVSGQGTYFELFTTPTGSTGRLKRLNVGSFGGLTHTCDVDSTDGISTVNSNTGTAAETRLSAYLAGTSTGIIHSAPSANNSGSLFGLTRNAAVFSFSNGNRPYVIGNYDNQPLVFGTNNLRRAWLTTDGYLGIGTSDPANGLSDVNIGVLTVAGKATNNVASYGFLLLESNRTTATVGDPCGGLYFVSQNNGTGPSWISRRVGIISTVLTGSGGSAGFGGDIAFYTKPDNVATSIEAMRITNAQKVVIGHTSLSDLSFDAGLISGGTATKQAKFEIASYSSGASYGGVLLLGHSKSNTLGTFATTSSSDTLGSIQFWGVNTSPGLTLGAYIFAQQTAAAGASYVQTDLVFNCGTSSAAPTEKFRITPTAIQSLNIYNQTSGGGANVVIQSDGLLVRSTSSLKYKKDIRDITESDVIQKLRPITYRSKSQNDDEKKRFLGFIAEEVEKIEPMLVYYGSDGQVEGFQYDRLTVLLVKEIQKLTKQVNEVTEMNERLKKLERKAFLRCESMI